MRKWIIGIIVVVILGAVGVFALQQGAVPGAQPDQPQVEPTLPPVQASDDIIADASVVPAQRAALNVPVSGIVAEILVEEDDAVEEGQLLLRLRNEQQTAAVAQAEAQLESAEARLAELQAGARAQEIQEAQASVDAAEARLAQLSEPPRQADVAAAQAGLASAQAGLDKVLEGPNEAELISARRDVKNAEAALQQAQQAYDEVKWRDDVGALPQSQALQEASNNYEAAQARLQDLQEGPSNADITQARAEVERAQAELQKVRTPGTDSEIAAAEAELRRARAQLELLQAGTREETIAAAEADVASAEAGLQQAQANLADTELRAPFAGTVGAINVKVGEQVSPGNPVVQLADLSNWLIETDDLTEFNVVNVDKGDPVTVTFDAIPELELPGTVLRIQPLGVNKQGDITYTVLVQPDETDPRLRWNMTAVTRIEAN